MERPCKPPSTFDNLTPAQWLNIGTLRANGVPWDKISKLTNLPEEELCLLPVTNKLTYQRWLHTAQDIVDQESLGEAMLSLRTTLRGDDDRLKVQAANSLTRLYTCRHPVPKPTKEDKPKEMTPREEEFHQTAQFYADMTPDKCEEFQMVRTRHDFLSILTTLLEYHPALRQQFYDTLNISTMGHADGFRLHGQELKDHQEFLNNVFKGKTRCEYAYATPVIPPPGEAPQKIKSPHKPGPKMRMPLFSWLLVGLLCLGLGSGARDAHARHTLGVTTNIANVALAPRAETPQGEPVADHIQRKGFHDAEPPRIPMPNVLTFAAIRPTDTDAVGGKGLSLGLLATQGLPVPPGFCVTTSAYRACCGQRISDSLWDEIDAAYQTLGGGCVAVRSSATAEDGAEASFAGQQETILGVEGADALKAAIERCWASLHTERAQAYRAKQGIDEAALAMAVVVQRLVEAEVAGVLFTRDPDDTSGTQMRVEASWGLGEAVVSGRVTPDRFQVDRSTNAVRERHAGRKTLRITRHGEEPVPEAQQSALCLDDAQLHALADLGHQVEAYYGDARDIEWAITGHDVWLLQARPITTVGAADRERVRTETITRLRGLTEPSGTVWSRTNLIEVLNEPTPLTWAVVTASLLSGGGGTGQMYEAFGFKPDPALASTSAYDLIGGRPYMNLSREPRLQAAKPLFGYPLARYKTAPHEALDPKPDTTKVLGGFTKWFRMFGMIFIAGKISNASKKFATEFRTSIIPAYVHDLKEMEALDLTALSATDVLQRWEAWRQRTLVDFAQHSLKPTLLAQFSWQVLEQQLTKAIGAERAKGTLAALSQGATPDAEANLPQAIRALASGEMTRDRFLERFGHRGFNEMELAAPRWCEDPSTLPQTTSTATHTTPPNATQVLEAVAKEAKWNKLLTQSMGEHVTKLQTYLGLRETGKHFLMRGYAQLRRLLLELDRRHHLNGGIFYLQPDELRELGTANLPARIATRKQQRLLERSLEVPAVLFSDDLEAIGRPVPPPSGAEQLSGLALSAGIAEGPALVLTEPTTTAVAPGYILVCPSTDPAWVPLFVHAKGLVMESGGTLSHGAIVAREFGLPAVAGLLGVQHRLQTGQRLRVDGTRGTVTVL